jgi:hypothetical protein
MVGIQQKDSPGSWGWEEVIQVARIAFKEDKGWHMENKSEKVRMERPSYQAGELTGNPELLTTAGKPSLR